MKDLKKWKILSSQLVLNHHWCKVRRDTVGLPQGQVIDDYFLSLRPDVALILPITAQQEIVFVRQYRHGASEILLELPAGTFDPNQENPQFAALRELEEETGYVPEEIFELGKLYDNPVKDTNKIHVFLGKNVALKSQQNLDITEEIEVVLIPIAKVLEKIVRGEICVAGTVAAISLGLQFLHSEHA